MTARKYSARYQCVKCDAWRTMTATAADYHMALVRLPRWIWPDGHRMRREGTVKLEGQ